MNTDHVLRAQAAREFDSRPALAGEFLSKEAYVAFKAAEARGACRIFGKPAAFVVRVSQPALATEFSSPEAAAAFKAAEARGAARIFGKPAAPAARSSVGAPKPPAGTMSSVLDAMAEFKRSGRSYIRTDLVAHVASRTGLSLHDASGAIADTAATTHYPVD